jgi:hypothetical protein
MKRSTEYPLQNTGATQAYDNKQLNEIFRTKKLDFLTTNPVDIIGRKFNWIPARRGDPPRSESDLPPIRAEYNCTNVGVKSDFPKTITNWQNANMWVDGDYEDTKNSIYKAEDEFNPNVQFRPDYDFDLRYNRMAQQNQLQSNIADYFQEQEAQRTIENRIFLEEYGLTGAEVDEVMARMKVEGALEAIKNPKRKVIGKKEAFERAIAKAVEQKMETAGGIGDMGIKRTPQQQSIAQMFGLPGTGRLPRARSAEPPKRLGLPPVSDNLEEEIDSEPSGFDRGSGGAAAPRLSSSAPLGIAVIDKLTSETFGVLTKRILDTRLNKDDVYQALRALGVSAKRATNKPELVEALERTLSQKGITGRKTGGK